jgi:bacteriophage CI repressor helix-turn-helix domain
VGLKQYKESKMKIFGTRLREVRKSKKITQIELANMLGISQKSYSHWENNKTFPSFENLIKLADLLEVSLDWLFGRE